MEERLRSEKWKRYKEFLVEGEKSPATVRKYIHDIQAFYLWLEEKELSKETLKEYKSWLSEHYKISSANSMIISLNLYLKFCGHAEYCLKTFKIQKKMFLEKDLELSKEEYFNESFRDIVGSSPFALFASLIDAETDAEELEQLEQLIAKKKEELKKEQ